MFLMVDLAFYIAEFVILLPIIEKWQNKEQRAVCDRPLRKRVRLESTK